MSLNKDQIDSYLYLKNFLIGKTDFSALGYTKSNLIDSGFYHLFVISGFHVGIIYLITSKISKIFFLSLNINFKTRYITSFISLIFCFYYIYLCNFPISAIRALSVICIYQIFVNFHLIPKPLNCLALIFLSVIAINPKIVNNPGFWYSFSNSAALIYFFRKYQNDNSLFNGIRKTWQSSLLCFFASTPICLIFFKKLQFAGIFSNLLAIPIFVFFTFPLSIVAYLLNTEILIKLAILSHDYLMQFAKFCSDITALTLEVLSIDKIEIIIIFLSVFLCIKARLQYKYLAIIIIIITSYDFSKAQKDTLLITSIPRSIDLITNDQKYNILKKSNFNKTNNCFSEFCILEIKDVDILIIKQKLSYQDLQKKCVNFDLVININNNNLNCYGTPTITSLDIYFTKQISIKINNKNFLILY
ncbi:ComEC/Rec2 family competence protein [Rickettsiales bacterium]|nr:ComEC/Rec2 family competence protein [Rickettsiales bacterium]